jgi:hypothetical protein
VFNDAPAALKAHDLERASEAYDRSLENMPLYTVTTQTGVLTGDGKTALAARQT